MYEMITRLLPKLQNAVYGTLKNETRVDKDGLPILPISFGLYHNWFLCDLGSAMDEFEKTYPNIHMDEYANILEKAGIEVSTKGIRSADVSESDGLTVMALIFGIFDIARLKDKRNSEHFLDPDYEYDWESPLIDIFRDRSIERWLLRLKEVDNTLTIKGAFMNYIAYGSNMNQEQMALRCPEAKLIGTGVICGARLEFYLHATVEKTGNEKDEVPVAVWEINETDRHSLDVYEGYPDYYIREQWPVRMVDGTEIEGMIYLMKEIRNLQPKGEYYEGIADAYRLLGLEEKIRSVLEPALKRSRERTGN